MEWRKLLLFCACLLFLQVAMGNFANALLQEEDHLEPTRKRCLIPLCCCKPNTWWCSFKHTCCC
ncbi:hypothetical protein MPTK1_4g18800 [Marchantia polymorpha subsp. ruderalis]|uniref:Uncharacterized protein n=2 Tax=Marchantia polymorpha TaxID=3197 RepID=A0AAF6BBD5_MARPO|nr:hypothetical protein MARPO_0164s0023 [Marchantia polymorpha]BBN09319.1 hypothetical protein Mp_4g18800 [Marchantia polymorpha subsp. ruderalis]|eukprot:PTQ28430.1 hypothetical protein MARPO_0164s0023 [Marchantia polymorpha]